MSGLNLGLGFARGPVSSAPAFTPSSLFSAPGSRGAVYDFTDWTKVFTDTARTTPVTANSQAIAAFEDISGQGNHVSQADAANRALSGDLGAFKCAVFDGSSDTYQTPAIDFSNSDELTVIVGFRKGTGGVINQTLLELGNLGPFSESSVFQLLAAAAGGENGRFAGGGSLAGGPGAATTSATYAPPRTCVYTGLLNVSDDLKVLRIDGVQIDSRTDDQGTGNLKNDIINIGNRPATSRHFIGSMTRIIIINRVLSPGELVSAELWVNAATGASFP